jgi:aminopeptidase N
MINNHKIIKITDYTKSNYNIPKINIIFDIYNDFIYVLTTLYITCNDPINSLLLNGYNTIKDLENIYVFYNNGSQNITSVVNIFPNDYYELVFNNIEEKWGNKFILKFKHKLYPKENTELYGLYNSKNILCTQCESIGFRRITYFIDRPDILSQYSVAIIADKNKYPILLSNGNLIKSYDIKNKRHICIWNDPSLKSCYLFALVAGNLLFKEDNFVTKNNNNVILKIYTKQGDENKVDHAMTSLKNAMKWDEEKYDNEYDLNNMNIVAIDDFNSGAMENKGLNIFNSKNILAQYSETHDSNLIDISHTIGHEYFHNWSGNKVTIEKWFDITLKEGLTNFREWQFMTDYGVLSAGSNKINFVNKLLTSQFPEDCSSNAHPPRPLSYTSMDIFYSPTVYSKGSTIFNIYETILGKKEFNDSLKIYFKTGEGKALSCEDFWNSMYNTNKNRQIDNFNKKMKALFHWYSQPGTPEVSLVYKYNPITKIFVILAQQKNIIASHNNSSKKYIPVCIPIKFSLFNKKNGHHVLINNKKEEIMIMYKEYHLFVFKNINSDPCPSFLRNFSAPIKINYHEYNNKLNNNLDFTHLFFLIQHESDDYIKWISFKNIFKIIIINIYKKKSINDSVEIPNTFGSDSEHIRNHSRQENITSYLFFYGISGIENENVVPRSTVFTQLIHTFKYILSNNLNYYLKAQLLYMPTFSDIIYDLKNVNPIKLHTVITKLKYFISTNCENELYNILQKLTIESNNDYEYTSYHVGRRKLIEVCFEYLGLLNKEIYNIFILNFYKKTNNLTDKNSAIISPCRCNHKLKEIMLEDFFNIYQNNDLIMLKWLQYNSTICSKDVLINIQNIYNNSNTNYKKNFHFNKQNPNHIYALIFSYFLNPYFHYINHNGEILSYIWITNIILELDEINSQLSSSIAKKFILCKNNINNNIFNKLKIEIQKILNKPNISSNLLQILNF